MIDPEKREKFRVVLQRMIDDGADEATIKEATATFKAKYGQTGAAGGMGDLKLAEAQSYEPEKSAMFPMASAVQGSGVGATAKRVGLGTLDILGAPSRAVSTLRGMEMSDPNAYLLRPEVERMKIPESEMQPMRDEYAARRAETMGSMGKSIPDWYGGVDPAVSNTALEMVGQVASDPLTFAGTLTKTLSYIPRLFTGAGNVAAKANKFGGLVAGKGTGAGEDALRYAGSPYGRARMERWFGRESEIGADVLNRLDDAPNQIPEAAQKNAILEQMPDMSVAPTIAAGEGRLAKFAEGTAGRGLAPSETGGATQAKQWIDWLRGGEAPPDLPGAAQKAGDAMQEAKALLAAKGAQAAKEAKEAARAEKIAAAAQTKAAKAASKAGQTKKAFLDRSDLAEKNRLRWSGERDAAGQAAESAMEEAQTTALQAREAAINARAKVAVGEISEAEATALEAKAETAIRGYYAAEVAARHKTGEGIGSIAEDLARRGMPKDDLRDVLTVGKKRVESIKPLPPEEMTAKELDRLRQKLDPNIDWVSDPDAADLKDKVLKAMRGDISMRMKQTAEASGNAEWADIMNRFHAKLESIDNMKDMIGKTSKVREKRIEAVVNNLFGKNKKWQQKFLNEFEANFGGNTVSRARAAQMAQAFGEGGKPGLLPVWGTGASSSVAANAAMVLPRAGAALVTGGFASPFIASRITLPALTKLEQGLKSAGIALTPRAAQAMSALKRPVSDAQRVRLASILALELENQLPANAIPFRQKVAEEDQPVDYVTRR